MAITVPTLNHTGTGSFQALTAVSGIELADIKNARTLVISATTDAGEWAVNSSAPTAGHPIATGATVQFSLPSVIEDLDDWATDFKIKGSVSTVFVISLWR